MEVHRLIWSLYKMERSILLSLPFSTLGHLISCSSTEPYPSLHHVFGMTCHLNSALFIYPHAVSDIKSYRSYLYKMEHSILMADHCQSQTTTFIRLLYLSPIGLSPGN